MSDERLEHSMRDLGRLARYTGTLAQVSRWVVDHASSEEEARRALAEVRDGYDEEPAPTPRDEDFDRVGAVHELLDRVAAFLAEFTPCAGGWVAPTTEDLTTFATLIERLRDLRWDRDEDNDPTVEVLLTDCSRGRRPDDRDEIWTTRDGREVPVGEMSEGHARNALRLLLRRRRELQEKRLALLVAKVENFSRYAVDELGDERYHERPDNAAVLADLRRRHGDAVRVERVAVAGMDGGNVYVGDRRVGWLGGI